MHMMPPSSHGNKWRSFVKQANKLCNHTYLVACEPQAQLRIERGAIAQPPHGWVDSGVIGAPSWLAMDRTETRERERESKEGRTKTAIGGTDKSIQVQKYMLLRLRLASVCAQAVLHCTAAVM